MRPLRNEAGFLSKVSSDGIIETVHGICNCNETSFTWDKDNLSCIRKNDDSGLPTYAWILISLLIVIILTAIGFAFLYAIKNKLIWNFEQTTNSIHGVLWLYCLQSFINNKTVWLYLTVSKLKYHISYIVPFNLFFVITSYTYYCYYHFYTIEISKIFFVCNPCYVTNKRIQIDLNVCKQR